MSVYSGTQSEDTGVTQETQRTQGYKANAQTKCFCSPFPDPFEVRRHCIYGEETVEAPQL